MTEYEIVAVLWQDHVGYEKAPLPENPDECVEAPTLTIGFLYKETDKTITVVSEIEPYEDRDEATFSVILKSTILGLNTYGKITLREFLKAS
jgi:hypothetical protein